MTWVHRRPRELMLNVGLLNSGNLRKFQSTNGSVSIAKKMKLLAIVEMSTRRPVETSSELTNLTPIRAATRVLRKIDQGHLQEEIGV